MSDERRQRGLELLTDEATQGLCPDDWLELDAALPPGPERDALLLELESLVARVALTELHDRVESLPAALVERLDADLSRLPLARTTRALDSHPPDSHQSSEASVVSLARAREKKNWVALSGWALAAAACIVAVFALSRHDTPRVAGPTPPPVVEARPPVVVEPSAAEKLAAARKTLLEHPAVKTLPWVATKDAAASAAQGDVVWDARSGRGVMRFHGLQPSDGSWTYQLWIFDAERDERHPVDGGTFDIGPSGEVLVAIDARVPVHRATLFAITVEPPGGVVVSKRERIVLTAAVPPT